MLRRVDDLAGIEEPAGSNQILDLAERRRDARRRRSGCDPLRAHQAVAVLAGVAAPLYSRTRRRPPRRSRASSRRAVGPHVEHGPHVQRARPRRGRTRCPTCRASRTPRRGAGVFGEVLERHRAILDEGHRFPVALHRHHDVQAGLAHLPEIAAGSRRRSRHDGEFGKPRSAISSTRRSSGDQRPVSSPGELDQQDRVAARPDDEAVDVGRKFRSSRDEVDHRAVDQFDRARPELHDVLGGVHRLVEGGEVATPSVPCAGASPASSSWSLARTTPACPRSPPAGSRGCAPAGSTMSRL
jgi:hypothetical protein